jgi:choline dehydrogenase-like flavoprotein
VIVDARELPPDHTIEADVCIVGAGAAGIALARYLGDAGVSVCLIESGGRDLHSPTQALYQGEYAGDVPTLDARYLVDSRRRVLGGTTSMWAGQCRPLEPIDFERRDWIPHSGWPLTREELDPWYRAASDLLHIPPFVEKEPQRAGERSYFEGPDTTERLFRVRPLRFGIEHEQALANSRNIACYLHANALELVTAESGAVVERLRVATLTGLRATVRARRFVVAAGGIENPRLLLASNGVQLAGLGNQHDQVGRFFMEHSVVHWGLGPAFIWGRNPMWRYRIRGPGPEALQVHFIYPTEEARARDRMFGEFDRTLMQATAWTDAEPGQGPGAEPPSKLRTVFMCESAPNPASRITLTGEKDALGMPRVKLTWKLTGREVETLSWFADLMSRRIGELGLGRMKVEAGPEDLVGMLSPDAHHHMGTTRMHDDPKQGVVDSNCRVHGVSNLYMAGSSVFPTSGAANPTFTLLALALRLANHLKG